MSKFKSKSNKKYNKPDSDSESDSSDSDSEYTYETGSTELSDESSKHHKKSKKRDDDEDADSMSELHKTLYKLFPSKYMKEKHGEKERRVEKEKRSNKERRIEKEKRAEKERRVEKERRGKSKKYVEEESEESDESEEESYENESEESEYETIAENESEEEYETDEEGVDDEKNFKITLTIGGNESKFGNMKNRVSSDLSKDEDYTVDDEKTFMRESYEQVGMPLSPSSETLSPKKDRKLANSFIDDKTETKKSKEPTDINIEDKYKEIIELKKVLYEKHRNNPKNKIIKKALEQCDHTVKKLIKHARSKNANNFEELLFETDIPENTDELGYFKHKLSNKEQLKVMNDLRDLNNQIYVEKPYRLSLLQSNLPANLKAMALQRLNQLSAMEPGESEYYKLKNWVDSFMRIPFGKYKNITINIADGIDKCSDFVVNAKTQLDNCVYGLNDAKMQIMQMVGQWISNPSSLGTAIAVKGPPGTGKTSLIKDGVSKILGREFAFIALGGCGDSSFLEGHSYTYEGSVYGKIVQILMDSKCMNPVIYFDELDKVSDTARGQEIISLLTHLTDTTQNNQFRDKYFSELDLDLSKCLFIFSYNDESLVNPILKDRMYRIQTKGYDLKDKQIIARNYMLPKIREQVGFNEGEVIIPEDVLTHIISNQAKGEAGVRNLKRCLEIIHTKLNLYRLVKTGTQLFDKEMGLQVSFPYTLTKKDVDLLVKNEDAFNQSVLYSMYV